MHTLTRTGALAISLLLLGSAMATAAPAKGKTKVKRQKTVLTERSEDLIRSGSTRYYDWQLSLMGSRVPTPVVPGKPVAFSSDVQLSARDHFVAVDSWGGAGALNFLNSAVPVDVRWTAGEAWASANQRFTNLVLVAVEGNPAGSTRPYLLQANGQITISPGTRALYAFFPDIGPLSDNRGEAQLSLTDRSGRHLKMNVSARTQAISMEQTNALPVSLTPTIAQTITYTKSNSHDGFLERPLRYALLVTDTAQGRHSLIVNGAAKSPLTFAPAASTGYLAWLGFENVTEGTGSTTFQIAGQRPGVVSTIPRSIWEDDLRNEPGYNDWNRNDNWRDTSGSFTSNSMVYELRLSNLAAGAQYTALLPIALDGVQPGDQVVITGQLPRDIRAGELRLYTADYSDMPLLRASLVAGTLAVTAEDDSAYSSRAWDNLVDDDPAYDNLLAIGASSSRQMVPAGSTFRLTVDVAPTRSGRTGNPFTCYIGLVMTSDADRAMTEALRTFDVADSLDAIRLNPGRGYNDRWEDDDDDWYQRD